MKPSMSSALMLPSPLTSPVVSGVSPNTPQQGSAPLKSRSMKNSISNALMSVSQFMSHGTRLWRSSVGRRNRRCDEPLVALETESPLVDRTLPAIRAFGRRAFALLIARPTLLLAGKADAFHLIDVWKRLALAAACRE